MHSSNKPLYGLVSGDGGHYKLVFNPGGPDDLVAHRQIYGESVSLFEPHAGSEIPIFDLRTLREPMIPKGVKEEYASDARYVPVRPTLAEFAQEANAKGAVIWTLSRENYQHAKDTGLAPGMTHAMVLQAASETLMFMEGTRFSPPSSEDVKLMLSRQNGPEAVAASIRKARLNEDYAATVCTWLHEGTGMYHFDGIDAVEVVSPSLGLNPPSSTIVDPSTPFGTMGVHSDVIGSKPGALHLVPVPSLPILKAVQMALDADRPGYTKYAAKIAELVPTEPSNLRPNPSRTAAILAELDRAELIDRDLG